MSHQAVAEIIGRAVTDPVFRARLLEDAASACAGYDLTDEELAALEELDAAELEAMAANLPEQLIQGAGGGFIVDAEPKKERQ
jgi:hypothetical protein